MPTPSALSRFDRLLAVLGGEQNLPAKVPRSAVVEASVKSVESDTERMPDVMDIAPASSGKAMTVAHLPPSAPTTYAWDSRKGLPAPPAITFCPFLAVTRYCYKFLPRDLMQSVAEAFFDKNQIWSRKWELYYLANDYSGAIAFVAESQLEDLLGEINFKFDLKLEISASDREDGLVLDFKDFPEILRPRIFGLCSSREQYQDWTHRMSFESQIQLNEGIAGQAGLEDYKVMLDDAAAISKNNSKNKKELKRQQRTMRMQSMAQQNLSLQRYLGLQSQHIQSSAGSYSGAANESYIDPGSPVPYIFEQDVIFIAIDVEAMEGGSRAITEVGVATLDTRDLHGKAPGELGEGWHKHIRARHVRTAEYMHHVNHEFVSGCPDLFDFGQSEFVATADMPKVLTSCFHEPFSGPSSKTETPAKRNLVMVGHDLGNDVAYCRKLGFDIYNRGNIIDTLDTSPMYRVYTSDPNTRSLASILYECGLDSWHLHNAGNDAVYTLHAMLAIAIKTATSGLPVKVVHERSRPQPVTDTDSPAEAVPPATLEW